MAEIGLFEAMYTQKAIRKLKPDPVSDELVHKLLDAAIRAPSGGNTQPWAFVVIRDAGTKRKVGDWYLDAWNSTYGRIPDDQKQGFGTQFKRVYNSAEHLAMHIGEAPVMILVCAKNRAAAGSMAGGYYASIFPAVQNLLLAARGLNLGACLTTLHTLHEAEVKELLGIPDSVETVALIPVGHPIGKYGPAARRPIEELTHYERWDPDKR